MGEEQTVEREGVDADGAAPENHEDNEITLQERLVGYRYSNSIWKRSAAMGAKLAIEGCFSLVAGLVLAAFAWMAPVGELPFVGPTLGFWVVCLAGTTTSLRLVWCYLSDER
ncbi:hypothetical protein [Halomarina oriensis]|uniref:Uncharacterized protein n=1 Tax=Halomarina oriensis TaxID=671145 RepID=A0A6B0GQP3_9EURY|nr:hypothetical protein [Halomarina oriensis]MWG35909.1 hypothetical protein [Halomarina oriensis]